MRDPNVLSVPEAARLAGKERHEFKRWIDLDPAFRAAVVIDSPFQQIRISRPRLMRRLHGDNWREIEAS